VTLIVPSLGSGLRAANVRIGAGLKGGEQMLLGLYVRMRTAIFGLRTRFEDETGAVATEYALLLTLIALAIVAAATALGLAIAGKFTQACTTLGGTGC